VRMILATIGQVITQAQAEYEAKYARRKSEEAVVPAPQPEVAVAATAEISASSVTPAQPQA